MFTRVDFGQYAFKTEETAGRRIFDRVRKRYVSLSPEEWVRQHVLWYLIDNRRCASSLLSVEKEIDLNGLRKRCDVVVYGRDMQARMIVECKAPEVPLTEAVIQQVLRYNQTLQVPFIWITNGSHHFCYRLSNPPELLNEVPTFDQLNLN